MKTMIVLASLFYVSSSFAGGEARIDCGQQQQQEQGKGQGQQQGKGQGQQQGKGGKGQGQQQEPQQPQQGKGGKGQGQEQQPQQQPQGKGGKGQTQQQQQQQQQCEQQQQQEACDTVYTACTTAGYTGLDATACVDDVLNGRSDVSVNMGDQMYCVQFKNEHSDVYHAWKNKLEN